MVSARVEETAAGRLSAGRLSAGRLSAGRLSAGRQVAARRKAARRKAGGRLAAWRRRATRGITVYVVLLVITMLSAVGVYATRSASLATKQAGHFRQMVQTHYITEYAMLATMAAIESDVPGHIDAFERHSADYRVLDAADDPQAIACRGEQHQNARCYRFGRQGLEARLVGELVQDHGTAIAGSPYNIPGTLGRTAVDTEFAVEATDIAQVVVPIAGQMATDAPLLFYAATLSATGQIGPPITADANWRSGALSLETARAQVTLGPVPAR